LFSKSDSYAELASVSIMSSITTCIDGKDPEAFPVDLMNSGRKCFFSSHEVEA